MRAQALESVRQLRAALSTVSQLGDEQRERLRVAGNAQGARIDGFEAGVADESGGQLLSACVVTAVHEAGAGRVLPRLEDAEKHLARDGVEGADYTRAPCLLRQLLGARRSVADNE